MSHFSEIDAHLKEQIDAIAAERDAAINRADANAHAAECAFRELEEERLARRVCQKDLARVTAERDSWKALATVGRAKFGVEV